MNGDSTEGGSRGFYQTNGYRGEERGDNTDGSRSEMDKATEVSNQKSHSLGCGNNYVASHFSQ